MFLPDLRTRARSAAAALVAVAVFLAGSFGIAAVMILLHLVPGD